MKILFSVLILFYLTIDIFSQEGSAGAQELLIPVGARSLGMNGAYIAGISGIEAVYYNPAGLKTSSEDINTMFSYMKYIADIGMTYASVSSNFGELGAFALSLKSLDIGDIPITTTRDPYGTGEFFSPTLLVAGFTYSRNLSDNLFAGFNTNIVYEKILETSASGVSFDFGFQYKNLGEINGFNLGAVLRNLGPQMKYDGSDLLRTAGDTSGYGERRIYKIDAAGFDLPMQFEGGLSYEKNFEAKYNFLVAAAYLNSSYLVDELKFAGEFNFDDLFFVRGGYFVTTESSNDDRNLFGPTFGVGLNWNTFFDVSVDYAYRYARLFDSNHLFTVKINF
jgi:opacity protein-like surface antigen